MSGFFCLALLGLPLGLGAKGSGFFAPKLRGSFSRFTSYAVASPKCEAFTEHLQKSNI